MSFPVVLSVGLLDHANLLRLGWCAGLVELHLLAERCHVEPPKGPTNHPFLSLWTVGVPSPSHVQTAFYAAAPVPAHGGFSAAGTFLRRCHKAKPYDKMGSPSTKDWTVLKKCATKRTWHRTQRLWLKQARKFRRPRGSSNCAPNKPASRFKGRPHPSPLHRQILRLTFRAFPLKSP
jgi:hypothetical protein